MTTILVPSAEHATACHDTLLEARVHCQFAPEFVETYIAPFSGGLVNSAVTATSRVPSADEAIDVQSEALGALLQVQFWAAAETPAPSNSKAVIAGNRSLSFMDLGTSRA